MSVLCVKADLIPPEESNQFTVSTSSGSSQTRHACCYFSACAGRIRFLVPFDVSNMSAVPLCDLLHHVAPGGASPDSDYLLWLQVHLRCFYRLVLCSFEDIIEHLMKKVVNWRRFLKRLRSWISNPQNQCNRMFLIKILKNRKRDCWQMNKESATRCVLIS